MIQTGKNGFGYEDYPWRRRALMCFGFAGLEGKRFITTEMADAIKPFVGNPPGNFDMTNVVSMGLKHGMIRRTGLKKRRAEGERLCPEYEIVGHMEDNDSLLLYSPVFMRGHEPEGTISDGFGL